jgi:hypothetical protein
MAMAMAMAMAKILLTIKSGSSPAHQNLMLAIAL